MPQGKRKYQSRVGMKHGTHRDKTKLQIEQRANDERVQTRLSEAREKQRALDARIRAEEAQAAQIEAKRLDNLQHSVSQVRRDKELAELKANIEKREFWPLSDARQLIRVGYTLESTIKRTGWPKEMLEDVRVGEW